MTATKPKPRRGRPPGKAKPTKRALVRPLTDAHWHFIHAYMVRANATRAYLDSHPKASWATADCEGSKLSRDPRIAKEIKRLTDARAKRLQATAAKIDQVLAAKAFASISDVYDEHGAIMQPHQMPREVALAVKKIKRTEILNKLSEGGEPELVGHTVEIEMVDQLAAARLLGERLGLFNAQPVQTLGSGFAALLEAAGRRVVEAARSGLIEGNYERVPDAGPSR
jgi:phage terminase small subunit